MPYLHPSLGFTDNCICVSITSVRNVARPAYNADRVYKKGASLFDLVRGCIWVLTPISPRYHLRMLTVIRALLRQPYSAYYALRSIRFILFNIKKRNECEWQERTKIFLSTSLATTRALLSNGVVKKIIKRPFFFLSFRSRTRLGETSLHIVS